MNTDDEIYRLGLQEKIANKLLFGVNFVGIKTGKVNTDSNILVTREGIMKEIRNFIKEAVRETLKEVGG